MRRGTKTGETAGIGAGARLRRGVLLVAAVAVAAGASPRHRSAGDEAEAREARELFEKVWTPGEPSPIRGDGIGPLYNATSCVACHHLGGSGGAGGPEGDVNLLTALPGPPPAVPKLALFRGELEEFHPGFRRRTTIVVHNHATDPGDQKRLTEINSTVAVQTREELIGLARSRRSTPSLFGAGLIDAIPDAALRAAEARTFPQFPEIKGRAGRLPGGRLGRFGWKGQTASLREFVLAACSNELGLEVAGHHQVSLASPKDFDPSRLNLDLNDEECDRLVGFVANLPRPPYRPAATAFQPLRGRMIFEAIGCATCHAPRMGRVDGLYSDLLLHDLGDRIRDAATGSYGGPSRPGGVIDLAAGKDKGAPRPAGEPAPTEWRTPPLWGIASSAPYLHDGRAPGFDDAIRLHGGEADATSRRYAELAVVDRQDLLAFLRSLVAPRLPRAPTDFTLARSRGRRK